MTLEEQLDTESRVTKLPPYKGVGRKSNALKEAEAKLQKRTTKTRKKEKSEVELKKETKWLILEDYIKGILTVSQIATKYSTSENAVNLVVTRLWKTLTNMRETRILMAGPSPDTKSALKAIHNTYLINQQFLELLSVSPSAEGITDSIALSDSESIYCWVYVHTGDNEAALKQAGLDIGLHRTQNQDDMKMAYDKALSLRGMYIRSLPHIAAYIKELREKRFIDQDISKTRIQSELIDQLAQMKESGDPTARKDILKTIELLGKTIGAFVERVEVTEVDPSKALDNLIEMAKTASVKELDVITSPKSIAEVWDSSE